MQRRVCSAWLLAAVLLFSIRGEAKLFRNAFVSFELPPNWDCTLEATEWVCVSQYANKSKEAIIILTAKEVGPTDSIAAYTTHLNTPRKLQTKTGIVMSKVLHVKQRQVNDQIWVDGMHMGSEVGAYYTRYLATVKDRIAILVTFSAHKLHYTKYSNDFLKAIESLRVVANKDMFNQQPRANMAGGASNETFGAPVGDTIPADTGMEALPEGSSGRGGLASKIIGLLLLGGALGYYFYLRKKKKSPP